MKKRLLSLALSLCMVLTLFPTAASAEQAGKQNPGISSTQNSGRSGMCENHTEHNTDCGYRAAIEPKPCGHVREDGSDSCAPVLDSNAATPGDADEKYTCPHDDTCGFTEKIEGAPCTHACEQCFTTDSGQPPAPACDCAVLCAPADAENGSSASIKTDCPVCGVENADLTLCAGAAAVLAMAPRVGGPTTLDISKGSIVIENDKVTGKDEDGNNVTAHDPDGYIITGSTTDNTITVKSGTHSITLQGVDIDVSRSFTCAFSIESGAEVNLTLSGTNTLISGSLRAGLQIPDGAALTIDGGDGDSLNATGGDYGAGIGGGSDGGSGGSGGTVTIYGGTVSATGSYSGAGIGGSGSSSDGNGGIGGTVTIYDGTVTATGSGNGAGIGGGGGSNGNGGSGGTVIISGGTVTATGGAGAGIGGGSTGVSTGHSGGGGTVNITGGIVIATSSRSVGIGGGGFGIGGDGANLTVDGDAVVLADSIGPGPGAGGSPGNAGDTALNKGVVFEGNAGSVYGTVTLPGDFTIPAGTTLTIPAGATLTIPDGVTLTNLGIIANNGEIIVDGTIFNAGSVTGNIPDGMTPAPDISKGSIELREENGELQYVQSGSITPYTGELFIIQTSPATDNTIEVQSGRHNVTLKDINIVSHSTPFTIKPSAAVNLTISGANKLEVSRDENAPGLEVPEGAELTINGTDSDSLNATGGGNAAGIGGAGGNDGNNDNGSDGANGGSIEMTGGTINTTTIGGGHGGNGDTIYSGGGSTGGYGGKGGNSSSVKITGGTINATAIGGGNGGNGSRTSSGGGRGGDGGNGGNIEITDSTVNISILGGGKGGNGGGSDGVATNGSGGNGGDGGSTKIHNGAVNATNIGGGKGGDGGRYGAIGGASGPEGKGGDGGSIEIWGGTVTVANDLGSGWGRLVGADPSPFIINGGSVKALNMRGTPKNAAGQEVFVGILENQSTIANVTVDGNSFRISANHPSNNSLYLFMTNEAKGHLIRATTQNGTTEYMAVYDSQGDADKGFFKMLLLRTTPAAPSLQGKTQNSITVDTVSDQKYIYTTTNTAPTVGAAGWVAGTGNPYTFTGLTPNTDYYIWTYLPGDATHADSLVSAALCATTAALPASGGNSYGSDTPPAPKTSHTLAGESVTISRSDLQALANAGKSLTLIGNGATLVFDTAALQAILNGTTGSVTFGIKKADISQLPDAQSAIGNRPVFSLTVTGGGKTVTSFGKGWVNVKIAYTPATGENPDGLYGVYVDGNGKVEWLTDSGYHAVDKAMLLRTGHFSTFGVGYKAAAVFSDTANHWARDDIDFVAARGLLTGTGNGQFSPNGNMTRGMFVTALGRLAGIDHTKYKNTKFTDVPDNAYYAPYTAWAAEKGITSGTTTTTFSPDQPITRQELAVLMQNYAKAMGYALPKNREAITYADNAGMASWAKDAVIAMQMAGVMNGKDGNKFDPAGTATRAEVAAVLRRYVELVVDQQTA